MTAEQPGRPQPQPQPPPQSPPQQESPSHQAQPASCGLGSLLSAGCRGRAEAFARRLSRRLQTLGMGGGAAGASADEERPFWKAPPSQPQAVPVQVQLARVPSDADVFYDPVDSPVEAAPPPAVAAPLQNCSSDSDSSEVVFFDPESSASTCSSAGEDEVFAAYNGRVHSSGSESNSTSTSDTGTLSGLSTSSSSAVQVQLPGQASASDDSRSTRTPSEETRSSPRSPSASDDSRPLSELSALEPTPSSYSTIEDSVATAEFSALEDPVTPQSDRLTGMPEEEEETLSAAVRRLGLGNGLTNGDCDCVVRLHNGKCVVHHGSLPNGPVSVHRRPEIVVDRIEDSTCQTDSDEATLNGGDSQTDYERTFVTVDLQMNCQLDIDANAPAEEGALTNDDGPRERISDEKSEEILRALVEEASEKRANRHEEATNGDADVSQQVECRIVVTPEPEEELEVQQEEEKDEERPAVNGSDAASNDEEEDSRPQRVRRCSSLKTGKTPPGTPGRKKIVRFADVLGLDLADVRTFLDEIPKIPSSAYDDLRDVDLGSGNGSSAPGFPPPPNTTSLGESQQQAFAFPAARTLVPLFQQPWTQPDFLDRVRDRQVCLESATLQDPALLSLCGVVRVRNLDFHKSVYVRYTMNGWRTWADAQARYVEGSCDGFSDRFSFTIYADALPAGGRLELAVRFQCRGAQFWDSNGGQNYAFQSVASAAAPAVEPLSPVDDRWPSFY